jgi:molybdopterin molybdotransferase
VQAGQLLRPSDVWLIASLGIPQVAVVRRLRVAVFSTGNELRNAGEPLEPGCIYDSNRYTLLGAVRRLGMEAVDLGLVRDDPVALEATLERAVAEADVVLTSGGVSVGEADYTRDLLARMGSVAFWKVAMRPGRPFAFGPIRGLTDATRGKTAWLFALPGNPVASLVTFYAFAREGLLRLAGARAEAPRALQVRSAAAIRKRPGRTEFQRGILRRADDGAWEVAITGAQGAGILRSMSEANALVVLQHDQGSVAAGALVEVWPFDGLV